MAALPSCRQSTGPRQAQRPSSRLLTIFLSTAGSGGIDHVVNGTGGSSTIANPDTPVDVVSYP